MSLLTRRPSRYGAALLLASVVSVALGHEAHENGNGTNPASAEAPFISENNAAIGFKLRFKLSSIT